MSGVLVFLHGYADDAESWRGAAEAMAPAGWTVLGPTGPVAAPGGRRAWFETHEGSGPDPGHVTEALEVVSATVTSATGSVGGDPGRVVLAGFSQGAAVALLWALTQPPGAVPIGAVVAIAGWLPDVAGFDAFTDRVPSARRVLVAYGEDDDAVPAMLSRSAAKLLERNGAEVTRVGRDVGHDPRPFVPDVRAFLGA